MGGLVATVIHNGPKAGVYFPVYDGNGNVMGYVRASDGGVVAQYEYGPFGELLRATGPWPRRSITSSPPNTTIGKLASLITATATTPQPRPVALQRPHRGKGGLNFYGYVGNDPINYIDSFGWTDCAALKVAIARMSDSIHNALHSMSDINQMFDSAQTSAKISLGISVAFAAQSVTGLGKALTANASKTAPIFTSATRGTIPVGVFTPSGKVAVAGSFEFNYAMYAANAARNTGAAAIGAKDIGSTLALEGAQDASNTVERILDPYGRLADEQNDLGASMSAQTYETIKGLQGTLRGMVDEYQRNCCK
ncbi:hypothetical protein NXS98_07410 [Fontisphaera persica]|uniref:hypothetical protein n=1 Tax=Fontisphaera persica TaxID=2974023 RepID=UPI0024C06FA7|nr:hypothetical protein [Fontisphaera persica]WCJ60937.1 hypothetical protein NXS98_07410 [Fontisphaera persica]